MRGALRPPITRARLPPYLLLSLLVAPVAGAAFDIESELFDMAPDLSILSLQSLSMTSLPAASFFMQSLYLSLAMLSLAIVSFVAPEVESVFAGCATATADAT